jgi:hypothetical protein
MKVDKRLPKGSTGASLGGRPTGGDSDWKGRQKRFRERQRRLSGDCTELYNRDSGKGTIPPNLGGSQ